MKAKAKFLIKQSINKKIKTKWFLAVNIILLILIVAGCNVDRIIKLFGGDFEETNKIIVLDKSGVYESINAYYTEMSKGLGEFKSYELESSDKSLDSLKSDIDEDNDSIIIEINVNESEHLVANLYSYDPIDTITNQVLNNVLNSVKSEYALANSEVTPEELAEITSPIEIESVTLNPELGDEAVAKDIVSSGALVVFLIPFFILIVLLVQMIGAEINDEKTTRGMEIIISNVSAKVHFFTKIIASTGFVVIQTLLLFLFSGIGLLTRRIFSDGSSLVDSLGGNVTGIFDTLKNTGMFDNIVFVLPLIIIMFILSFLAYALLAGILASMTTSIEDYQQLQAPLMGLLMVGYYAGIMASIFDGSLLIKILSFIPFLSTLIAPILYLIGQTSIYDLILSNILLIGTCYLLFKYGIRIYKVGILNYSSKNLWKKIFKSLKEE